LIYLHSNVGSRKDVLKLRDLALTLGFSVFAFDFSGSGHSDGIYVTMGWNESVDLKCVLADVDNDATVTSIGLYAHSMGAYPAILNVASNNQSSVHGKLKVSGGSIDAIPLCFRSCNVRVLKKAIRGMVLDGGIS
jgi:hypothetical protein